MRRPLWAAALCFVAVAAVWLQIASPPSKAYALRDDAGRTLAEGEELTVTGRVSRLESRSGYGREILQIYLDSIAIQNGKDSGDTEGTHISYGLICEVSDEGRPRLGSALQIKGRFSYFSQAANPGEFDSAQYYRILGIGGTLKNAEIVKSGSRYSHIREGLYRLKNYFKDRLYQCYPEKEASILCTMLLGDKSSLDSEVKELYMRNGIVHILSISGLHITLIGMGIYRLLRKCGCPVPVSAAAGGILLLFYGGLTGMGVSACRAIGMYLIRMLGECLGRTYDMLTALGVMGVVMLAGQPEYLRHSGFLLSFGSICGIGMLLPAMPSVKSKIGQSFMAGASITLFTLPIQLCFYYEIPVYSVFLNLLVLPFVGVIMVTGLAVMLVPGLGFLSWADRLIFTGYELLCGLWERFPFHTWRPGCPDIWQVVLYYGMLLLLAAAGKRWKHRWKVLLIAGAVFLLGIKTRSGLTVTFLDVGQGDGICLQTDSGEVYLFDGGSSTESRLAEYTLIPFLKYQGISRVDAVFLSHPDTDHCSGILELLQGREENGISIGHLVLPAIAGGKRQEELGELIEAAGAGKMPAEVAYLARGDAWQSGEVSFTCLHPPEGYETEDINAYSECILVACGEFTMLLTGDVEGEGEELLIEELNRRKIRDLTVLKVAHHGSRNSTPEQLLKLLNPRISVISCGKDNRYGHPHKELLERLGQTETAVLQTPLTGAVRLQVNGSKMHIYRFLNREGIVDTQEDSNYNKP